MTDLYPNAEPLYLDIFANIASSGQSYSFETHFEKLNAYFRIIAFSPLRGQCAIIFEDITEKKLWENTLRESEERLRLTLNSTGQGLYDINMQTGEITSTPEYARMLGYDPIDFHDSQAKLFKRIHPDDLDKIKKLFTIIIHHPSRNLKLNFAKKLFGKLYLGSLRR
jgi:PAS domain-containing protein